MWEAFKTDGHYNPVIIVSFFASVLLLMEKLGTYIYNWRRHSKEAAQAKLMSQTAYVELSVRGDGVIHLENVSDAATARNVGLYLTDNSRGTFASTECPGRMMGNDDPIPDMEPGDEEIRRFGFSYDFHADRISVEWQNEDGSSGRSSIPYHW
jgi:hypothetical protein